MQVQSLLRRRRWRLGPEVNVPVSPASMSWCWKFAVVLLLAIVGVTASAEAQGTATLVGVVVDSTGGLVPGATVTAVNTATGLERTVVASREGHFTLLALPPGSYSLRATATGLTQLEQLDVVLNVDDRVSVKVELAVASRGESVTVQAEAQRVSTSAEVATVINRQFVENLPLNGRSLQSLLELTPGVVATRSGVGNNAGQFSINGQRAVSNSFTVDGVSANTGIIAGASTGATSPGHGASGSLPAMTAMGSTQGLVSIDALQEFRVHTSTYAPEFGRTPGGQISMVTRSGSNTVHGTLFDYVRHNALDANNWFQNRDGLPEPKLRQQNFGGTVGGPLLTDRLFYFGSYEGARLRLPKTIGVTVPSLDYRSSAPPSIRPLLEAFPVPNSRDLAPGFSEYLASYSDPSEFDSTSARIDHTARPGLTVFGRVSHTPSLSDSRSANVAYRNVASQNSVLGTFGSTWVVSNRMVHDIRVNFTKSTAEFGQALDTFGGAVPPPTGIFSNGRTPDTASFVFVAGGASNWFWGNTREYLQRQWNIVQSVVLPTARHEWKLGLDYRRLNPRVGGKGVGSSESLSVSPASLALGRATSYFISIDDGSTREIAYDNLSLFAQDNWRPSSRLSITFGFRWEYVPPPHPSDGSPSTVEILNLDNPYGGQVALGQSGKDLWETRLDKFAPRIGASYVLSQKPGAQLVVRGGVGLFYDLAYGQIANAFTSWPFTDNKTVTSPAVPLTPDVTAPPVLGVTAPGTLWAIDPNIDLPVTRQWNVSAEQSLGAQQNITVSYVGAKGTDLLKSDAYSIILAGWTTATSVRVQRNTGRSDYHALQLQYTRRLHRGIQAIASYSLGRSRDTDSRDDGIVVPTELIPNEDNYGYSDFDVRHILSAAVTLQAPRRTGGSLTSALMSDWGLDVIYRGRSAFPISVVANTPFPPSNQQVRPNLVPGQPIWLDDVNAPGGRRLNRDAFAVPAPNTQGNLPRGAVRGFSLSQFDLSVRRDFAIAGPVRAQLRWEIFNILNTPHFAPPDGLLSLSTFGVSRQMFNQYSGAQGLNALYQNGGPRSMQLAAKLLF